MGRGASGSGGVRIRGGGASGSGGVRTMGGVQVVVVV